MASKWAKFQMPSLSDADDIPDGVVIQIVASDWSVVAAPGGDWSQPLGLEKAGGQEGSKIGDVFTVVVVKTAEPNREAASSRSLWGMFGFSNTSSKGQSVWGRKQEGGSDDEEEEGVEAGEGEGEAEVEEMEVHVALKAPNGCALSAHADGSLRADTPPDADLLDCHVFRVTRNVRTGKFAFYSMSNERYLRALQPSLLFTSMVQGDAETFSIRRLDMLPKFLGVNLGGWLVAEAWMCPPALFEGVFTDLLDGTSIQLQSVDGKWVAAEGGGGDQLRANRDAASAWETFFLRRADHGAFFIRAGSGHFWSVDAESGEVFANKEDEEEGEMFWVRHKLGEEGTVQLRAANGNWVQALEDGRLIADIDEDAPRWDTTCTFTLSKLADMGGEAQLMLALGREEATRRLQQHREEWAGEGDFEWMAKQGVNAVRIPVGWWVAVDPTPEEFVEGALELLDKAMDWAHTHSIRVIVCLHAAPGSQNGWEHSASRDGIPMWGKPRTPFMDETVDAIRFLVQRYASHPAFAGLEPINEPRADAVSFDDLARYYERCYAVLREHSPSAYFVISGRIFANEREWDDFMTSAQYSNVIYDAHWYQVHDHAEFGSQSVDFNLQYPAKQRAAALQLLERGQRLVFVGEWSLALLCDTSDDINSRFAKAQLQAYLASSSGSFFWSLKHGQGWDPWSFKASVERRWMTPALWPWSRSPLLASLATTAVSPRRRSNLQNGGKREARDRDEL
ncbi:hypothetical protein CLOM_g15556 [Closterium sp. NIES-68]|nr:hypothetical protein CLOM_g3307 [Closterium sp. NIES-68]GJP56490.1 hypothetical protein CLOM_g15556 [Closterium sp. NIES-68]GJP62227.1 hypothetical protein CLOP_g19314 [Closterium sp. NIES-67]GJP79526.1 hypothetical protein CLOP_g9751 [Closterium sp. NIES-67]